MGKDVLAGHDGFGFTSHWLRKWRVFFQPITECNKAKAKPTRNYFRHSIENRSIHSKLTHLANERMFSSITPLARSVAPSATISEHFSTVFVLEQIVRFIPDPCGVGEWFSVVPTRKLAARVAVKSDPNGVISKELCRHALDEGMLVSVVYGDEISSMLLAASFCCVPEMFSIVCFVAGSAVFRPAG